MNSPKLLAIITILLWASGVTFGRLISLQSQYLLLSLSFSFTFITQLIYTYYKNKNKFIQTLKNLEPKFLFVGLFGYGIYWLGFIKSFQSIHT